MEQFGGRQKNYTDISLYDYLCYCTHEKVVPKLAGVITDKQKIINIVQKDLNDHWDMMKDIFDDIYTGIDYDFDVVDKETLQLFSSGKDMIIALPKEVSEFQYECLLDILRQVKRFEYEYDTQLFMVSDPEECLATARERLKTTEINRTYNNEQVLRKKI